MKIPLRGSISRGIFECWLHCEKVNFRTNIVSSVEALELDYPQYPEENGPHRTVRGHPGCDFSIFIPSLPPSFYIGLNMALCASL